MRIGALPALALGLLLSSCAGQTIRDRLPTYGGQPASALIAKLGFPSRQDNIAGRKVYVWTTSNFIEGTNYACTIRAIVDDQETIVTTDFQGNEGGCASFASKLR